MTSIVPVVLGGGTGTRLWPLSRSLPKALMNLGDGRSLLQATLQRLAPPTFDRPMVVVNRAFGHLVPEQAKDCGIVLDAVLTEPLVRDTAFAVAVAACWLARNRPDAVMLVCPADHVIDNPSALVEAVAEALPAALSGYLVTFGIAPAGAETSYGYIEKGRELICNGTWAAPSFVEKPDSSIAAALHTGGQHYWNSGMFLFAPAALLSELAWHIPAVTEAAHASLAGAHMDGDFVHLDGASMEPLETLSLDCALLQQSQRLCVHPVKDLGWSDVGSWNAFADAVGGGSTMNAAVGTATMIDTDRTFVHVTDGRTLVTLGVRDLVIVSTREALLVANRASLGGLKQAVEDHRLHEHEPPQSAGNVSRPPRDADIGHYGSGESD